jgi:hypothetical protein
MPHLNYTGRKKISRNDAFITLVDCDHTTPSFSAELHLDDYNLPENARVYIEAYRQTSWMRFDFGTVGNIVKPEECLLSEFGNADGIRFRVKITSDEKPNGKLLAAANGIRPREPAIEKENRISLLPVRSENIDSIWKIIYSEDGPELLISRVAGDKEAIALSPAFRSLVFSAVLREILMYILHGERTFDPDDIEDWRVQWLQFARSLGGIDDEIPPEDDEIEIGEWVDDAVSSFSRKQKDIDVFSEFWQGREG